MAIINILLIKILAKHLKGINQKYKKKYDLDKVLSLQKTVENGYASFKSVAVVPDKQETHLLNSVMIWQMTLPNAFSWCFLKLDKKELLIYLNFVPLTFAEPHRVSAVL